LEEIDNADAFVKNLEKIELPTQLVAVMADPLLQKFLLLRPDAEGSSRISNWLMACLGDVASGDADSDIFLDMIEVIHDYAAATKVCEPPKLCYFLANPMTDTAPSAAHLFCAISWCLGRHGQAGLGS
jgi:centromere protein I